MDTPQMNSISEASDNPMAYRRIRFFRSVRCPGDWELDFVFARINIRIARSQFAIWLGKSYRWNPINLRYGYFVR